MSPIAGTVSNKKSELVDNPLTWLQFTDLVYIDAPAPVLESSKTRNIPHTCGVVWQMQTVLHNLLTLLLKNIL